MKLFVSFILIIALASLADCYSDVDDDGSGSPEVNYLSSVETRFRRSPDPEPRGSFGATFEDHNLGLHGSWQVPNSQGTVTAGVAKSFKGPERRPSYNIGYQQPLFQNKHGSVHATVGAQKFPGQKWQPNVGVGASFRFRRSLRPDSES